MAEEITTPPTDLQLLESLDVAGGDLHGVMRTVEDSWRHGVRVTQVFHRKSDDSYWMAHYRMSTDQEHHGLREGEAKIIRVYPYTKNVVDYTEVDPGLTAPEGFPDRAGTLVATGKGATVAVSVKEGKIFLEIELHHEDGTKLLQLPITGQAGQLAEGLLHADRAARGVLH